MSSTAARKLSISLPAVVLLATGLLLGSPLSGSAGYLLAGLSPLTEAPLLALALLGIATWAHGADMRLLHFAATILAIVAAYSSAISHWSAAGDRAELRFWLLMTGTHMLAGSILLGSPWLRRLTKSGLTMFLCLSATGFSTALLLAELLTAESNGMTSYSFPRIGAALGGCVLGIAWFLSMYRNEHYGSPRRLQRLALPAALASLTSTSALIWLTTASGGFTADASALPWAIAVVGLVLSGLVWRSIQATATCRRHLRARYRQIQQRRGERERAREGKLELQRAWQRYDDLFHSVPAPILVTSPTGQVISANAALTELLGIESEEKMHSMNLADFYAESAGRKELIERWAESDENVFRGETKMRRCDGQYIDVTYSVRVFRAADRRISHLQGTITDITELRRAEATRKKLESNLRLSQKLESVGRLAAGIAHEINTPMQYVGDNIFFLGRSFESLLHLIQRFERMLEEIPPRPVAELAADWRTLRDELDVDFNIEATPGALERAKEGIEAVSQIVGAMKQLAHPGEGTKVSADVNELIETALTVSRNAYKTIATIDKNLEQVPNILCYKNELCQVIINLIINAAQAIDSAKRNRQLDGVIGITTSSNESSVIIKVADNGGGIPESVREKIFDPFFTTKAVGEGTGQGLALARTTIVDKHSGTLDVDSKPGDGAEFTITLPTKQRLEDGNRLP